MIQVRYPGRNRTILILLAADSTLAFISNDGVYYVALIFDGEMGAGLRGFGGHPLQTLTKASE
jgi:hypothetical protein